MKYKPEEVREYVAAVSDANKVLFSKLQSRISKLYPDAKAVISYQILMFKRKDGWAAIGTRKDGVSLYTGHPAMIESFRIKHPDIKTGKGCLNFKVNTEIPWDDVDALICYAMEFKKKA